MPSKDFKGPVDHFYQLSSELKETKEGPNLKIFYDGNLGIPWKENAIYGPTGEPIPRHQAHFYVGKIVEVEGQSFEVRYQNDRCLVLEPASLILNLKDGK